MIFPKYLVRPDDHEIFSLNEDGKTYTIDEHKKQFPGHLHHKYTWERLVDLNFFPCEESDIPDHRRVQRVWHLQMQLRACHDDDE